MVVLRVVPGADRLDGGDGCAVPQLAGAGDRVAEQLLLRGVRGEHGRPVLGADVGTLPVELPRVVQREEDVEDDVGGDDLLVEDHLHRLGVPGRARAHGDVGGMGGVAADVAGDDVLDAVERAVDRIEAPEAAAGEDECLHER